VKYGEGEKPRLCKVYLEPRSFPEEVKRGHDDFEVLGVGWGDNGSVISKLKYGRVYGG
jgi:hypothetical protein